MNQKEHREQLEAALEKFGSPFMSAAMRVLIDRERTHRMLDDYALYGCTTPNPTAKDADKMAAMVEGIMTSAATTAVVYGLPPHVILVLWMFEAGRGYEREQLSIGELERMMLIDTTTKRKRKKKQPE